MSTKTSADARMNHAPPDGIPRGAWRVLPELSQLGFRVKKMALYHVKGRFKRVEGRIEFAPEAAQARGELVIDARSITTRIPPRDLHLRSRDFLAVKDHPQIRVTADSLHFAGRELRIPATFEIRGATRTVELSGHTHGGAPGELLILHLTGVLDRHEFGVRPRQPFEMVVGRQVELDVELVLEPAAGRGRTARL